MPRFRVSLDISVPGVVELDADTEQEALEQAERLRFGDVDYDLSQIVITAEWAEQIDDEGDDDAG